jgi:hypothetical protein
MDSNNVTVSHYPPLWPTATPVKESMIRSDTINKISVALVAAQKNMSNAAKGSNNPFFKSKYADLNAIREAVLPVLNENGISVLQLTGTNFNGKPVVTTTLLHESGEYISAETEIVVSKQNDPQAQGSAISYARRYGLQAMVCIGAEDDDGEKAMSRTSAPAATKSTFTKPAAATPPPATAKTVEGWD